MKQLRLPAAIPNILTATEWLKEELTALGAEKKAMNELFVAADEILSNICKYAYTKQDGDFELELSAPEEGVVSLTFSDGGTPFDPLKAPEPAPETVMSEETIGGLGLLIVRRTMDRCSYEYCGGENRFTVTKRIFEGKRGNENGK